MDQLISVTEEGINGANFALSGSKSLFDGTKIISGESTANPKEVYAKAQVDLKVAQEMLTKIQAKLQDDDFLNQFHPEIKKRAIDLSDKLKIYSELVEQGRLLANLVPNITAVGTEKNYLVLIEDNLELRPSGGVVTSYAKLTFKNGRLSGLKVGDISEIDNKLTDVILPPTSLRTDLGIEKLTIKDSSFEPDFPSSARQAEFMYKRANKENLNGVFVLDVNSLASLITAIGGVKLSDPVIQLDSGDDFIEKYVALKQNPDTNLKKNFLTLVTAELMNKVFYLPQKNWPELIAAMGQGLTQKDIQMYLSDSQGLSYLVSQNWAGVMPRGTAAVEGKFDDFLAVIDSNIDAKSSDYYIEKSMNLKTTISKEDFSLSHQLEIKYKNNQPETAAQTHKGRVNIYLPVSSKVTSLSVNGTDFLKQTENFSDYGRQVSSFVLEIPNKTEQVVLVEYGFVEPLAFQNNKLTYSLDLFKQAGQKPYSAQLVFDFPASLKISSENVDVVSSDQGLNTTVRMSADKSFIFNFQK